MLVVLESLRGWGEETVRVVSRLAGALARHTGQEDTSHHITGTSSR